MRSGKQRCDRFSHSWLEWTGFGWLPGSRATYDFLKNFRIKKGTDHEKNVMEESCHADDSIDSRFCLFCHHCKIGDNTTIKADGATIIQTDSKKGMMANDVDALNYNSLKT